MTVAGLHETPAEISQPIGVVATPFAWRDPSTIPPRDWLFGRHAIRGFLSVTGAPGGVGKTALMTTEILALVTGRDLLQDHLRGSGRAWYIGLEDPLEEYQRRFAAAVLQHGIDPDEVDGRLFLDSGRDQEFVIASESKGGVVIAEPIVRSIIQNIIAHDIAYIVVDPFVASHRVDESANIKIETVARQWSRVAQETNAAIELVHHLRKGSGTSLEPTADELRGASSLVNAARSVRVLAQMTKDEADSAGVDERRRFFRVQSVKANLALPSDAATWRQLVSVSLDNGITGPSDMIGVATAWKWPSVFENMTTSDLRRVQTKVSDGQWRESSQASDWVGKAVADTLCLDLADARAKSRVKGMLKTWIANKAFKIVEKPDEKRMPRKFVEVGVWVD